MGIRPKILWGYVLIVACGGGQSRLGVDPRPESPISENSTSEPRDLPEVAVAPIWQARACTGISQGLVLCVDQSAQGRELGTSAAPFHSISAAVAASTPGSIIQVAAGRYLETVRITAHAVALYGGFARGSRFEERDSRGQATIIDGSAKRSAVEIRVPGTRLDGFVVTGGRGICDSYTCEGGGVFVDVQGASSEDAVVVIADCSIHNNEVTHEGHNTARGGGVAANAGENGSIRLLRNHIYNNRAERGGGISSEGAVQLIENHIVDNVGLGDHGGGVIMGGRGIVLTRNVVRGNELGKTLGYGWGGGVLILSVGTTFRSQENLVTDNFAASGGSGFYVDNGAIGTMHNDRIVKNRCGSQGGAGLVVDSLDDSGDNGSIVNAYNLTIADNACAASGTAGNGIWVEGKGSAVHLHNSILWNNAPAIDNVKGEATITARYTLSEEALPGVGNLQANPRFVAPATGDYHLQSIVGRYLHGTFVKDRQMSPAIDRGDPTSRFSAEPTPNGGRINLGAFGNTPQASQSQH